MSWKCPQCGVENDAKVDMCAGMCGHVRVYRLVLTSSSGQELRFQVDTSVGRSALTTVCGEEARFASQPQFTVSRDAAKSRWLIQHEPQATNITFLNGAPIGTTPHPLSQGDVISLGAKRLALKVRLEIVS
jgi:pSer/pThr/pTyr-binding forkhead associated (FHA) protein